MVIPFSLKADSRRSSALFTLVKPGSADTGRAKATIKIRAKIELRIVYPLFWALG
jgi:hypothetical protein